LPDSLPLRRLVSGLALAGLMVLGACGPATLPPGDQITDAGEATNRAIHRFNLALDQAVVGPTARGYGTIVPDPVRAGVGNFAANLSHPSYIMNNLLQVRVGQASQNLLRFLVNSTVGLAGLFDPATALGLPETRTDFGETLHVWGVGEGDFVMLPGFGPSTTRDTVGLIVDMASNPVRVAVAPAERSYVTATQLLDRLGDRYEMDDTLDGLLYESADSYAQLRSLYLQNRRFNLGGATAPQADVGDELYADPYVDPY
jgi:phospholipid-binding lipoprotein MlaA